MAGPQLVVMAAGIGSRYGGLKQVDPVGPSGEIVIDYSVYDALRSGFEKVIFIIRRDIEEVFRAKVGRSIEKRVDTAYVFQDLDRLGDGFVCPPQREKPWGTGHAVLCASDEITGPFAVINADDFYGAGALAVLGDYLRTAADRDGKYDYAMVGYILGKTLTEHGHVARGVCTTAAGRLVEIIERTQIQRFPDGVKYTEDDGQNWVEIDPDSTVSMNMWGFTPGFLDELHNGFDEFCRTSLNTPKAEFFVPVLVNDLIVAGKTSPTVLMTDEQWYGVTYQEDKPAIEAAIGRMVDSGKYPENLWG
ncbi:MAG: sugar phosphate nucleotidyltransferase [Phycisphaerae bacterium]|jgi:choline kinase|nr:sugar phosphate nucleotidyltransferase [Phycisphaerae bacterium]